MKTWELNAAGVEPHEPQILSSASDVRTVLLQLPAGEELQEHEVHERTFLVVSLEEKATVRERALQHAQA